MEKRFGLKGDSFDSSQLVRSFGKFNSLLNYDFCPSLNRYTYWLKQPIGWVVCGAGFSATVGFLVSPQGFVLMWAFLALIVIGAVWPWLCLKRVDCQLVFDRSRGRENGAMSATIEITNKWPLPVFGLMVEGQFLLDSIDSDDVAVGLQRVPGWSVSRFSWKFEPKQRGVLPMDEPILTNGFPFGIYKSQTKIDLKRQTIVWPESTALQGIPGFDGTQFNIAGMMSDRSGIDGDVIGVRQYRQGDSLKHIHWGKSASRGRLIVQERQTCAQRRFEVILDLSPASHQGTGSKSSFEWAIRIASSVCAQLHQHQVQFELTCLGLPTGVPFRISNFKGLGAVLDFLARLPHLDELVTNGGVSKSAFDLKSTRAKRFVVCTSQSVSNSAFHGAHLIELDAGQFEDFASESPASPATTSQIKSAIQILTPELAFAQLKAGWEHGVCNGA